MVRKLTKTPSNAGSAPPRFSRSAAQFRRWLATNYESKAELLVGFHKRDSGRDSMTWPESVTEALCVGWIDGVRRRIDDDSYSIRFTPRKQASIWSAVNVTKMQELIDAGLVSPAGIRAFERRSAKKSAIYAYENRESAVFDAESEREFKRHRAAWCFFESCPPWYRRTAIWRTVSAKRPGTRAKRLAELIACCAQGRSIPTLALTRAPRPRA